MNNFKPFLILPFCFLTFLLFSGCQNSENLGYYEIIESDDFTNPDVSDKGLNLENLDSDDFFEGIEVESEDQNFNNLGADILDGKRFNGSYFSTETGLDLHELIGDVDFGDGSFTKNGKQYPLNPGTADKVLGFKIQFKNADVSGTFDSISYGGYGLENLSVLNGVTKFKLYFQDATSDTKSTILNKLFTGVKPFSSQFKYTQNKRIGRKYETAKIHSDIFTQDILNEDGGKLIEWPCLTSDFTYEQLKFKEADEPFSSESSYVSTNTGYLIGEDFSWSNDGKVLTGALCALNDTYMFSKKNVVGSECREGESYGAGKKDVGRIVYRPNKNSFCTQAASIEEEEYYPEYACNTSTGKTLVDTGTVVQNYFGTDVIYLSGSTVDDGIQTDAKTIAFTCGKH